MEKRGKKERVRKQGLKQASWETMPWQGDELLYNSFFLKGRV